MVCANRNKRNSAIMHPVELHWPYICKWFDKNGSSFKGGGKKKTLCLKQRINSSKLILQRTSFLFSCALNRLPSESRQLCFRYHIRLQKVSNTKTLKQIEPIGMLTFSPTLISVSFSSAVLSEASSELSISTKNRIDSIGAAAARARCSIVSGTSWTCIEIGWIIKDLNM